MKTSMLIKKCIYVVKITYYLRICYIQKIYTKYDNGKRNRKNMIMEREIEKKKYTGSIMDEPKR